MASKSLLPVGGRQSRRLRWNYDYLGWTISSRFLTETIKNDLSEADATIEGMVEGVSGTFDPL